MYWRTMAMGAPPQFAHVGSALAEQAAGDVLAVHLHQPRLKVPTDALEDVAKDVDCCSVKDTSAIFCNEDQVHVHIGNTVPAASNGAF